MSCRVRVSAIEVLASLCQGKVLSSFGHSAGSTLLHTVDHHHILRLVVIVLVSSLINIKFDVMRGVGLFEAIVCVVAQSCHLR